MRLTPDTQMFNALSREAPSRDGGRRGSEAAAFSRQAAISDAYGRSATPVATSAKPATTADTAERAAPETGSQRREAPMGHRPKFVPKGQTINLLV
jgi:hypothetical protein